MRFITVFLFTTSLFSQSEYCHSNPSLSSRSIYNIGDTLSIEDQNLLFPVCSGADGYNEGDFFSFSDLNGNLNGGDHKLTIISMNATWWPACYDYISLMDELIEFVEPYNEIQFLVSLDYSTDENEPYNCTDWSQLYPELGEYGNSPLILDGDPSHVIWNMFAGSTYSAYAFIDHNMVLRYKFDIPNLYDFQYTYIPNLLNEMYGCTDSSACNFSESAVFDDDSCQYGNDCNECETALNQLACMDIEGCMWMGDHCMESVDNCMDYENEIDCTNQNGCYWMGDHCMTGSNCADPIAYNYNPIADSLGQVDNTTCEYSPDIYFGCTYENAINFNSTANVDDGSCSHELIDVNQDGIVDILDIILIVQIVIEG